MKLIKVGDRLKEIKDFNHNTSTFTFELPEGTTSGLSVASALVVKSATEGLALAKNGKPAVRPYTPVTSPSKEGELVSPLPTCYLQVLMGESRSCW